MPCICISWSLPLCRTKIRTGLGRTHAEINRLLIAFIDDEFRHLTGWDRLFMVPRHFVLRLIERYFSNRKTLRSILGRKEKGSDQEEYQKTPQNTDCYREESGVRERFEDLDFF